MTAAICMWCFGFILGYILAKLKYENEHNNDKK